MSTDQALRWLLANPTLAASIAILLLGGADALREYRRTGQFPYKSLPWRAIRRVAFAARRRWFRHPKPEGQTDTVAIPIDDVRERLGRQGYEPAWPFSLHYAGEDINARRYVLRPDAEFPHRQLHIRAWDRDGLTELYAHEEPSALHHPRAHLESGDMTDATSWVAAGIHNNNGLDPRGFHNRSQTDE